MAARSAFSLIELLVVIAIIAVLAAMLVPTIQTVREASKRMACLANTRQLIMAVVAYTGENEGLLPNIMIKVAAMPQWGGDPNNTFMWCDDRLAGAYLDLSSWSGGINRNDGKNILSCPSDRRGKQQSLFYYASYGMNYEYAPFCTNLGDVQKYARNLARYTRHSDRLLIIECNESRFLPGWGTPVPMTQSLVWPTNNNMYGDPGSWHNWRSYHDGRGANGGFMDGHAAWVPAPQAMARSGEILVR